MSTVGFALASLASFAFAPPPEDASSEDAAPIIVVSPAAEPAPAPPPSVPDWGPSADVVVTQPAPQREEALPIAPPAPFEPPRKPMMGVGLFVGSAIAFGVGLGSRVGQVDVAMGNCRRWNNAGFDSLTRCFDSFDPPGVDGNDLFVGAAYGSSIVLSMVGAGALGQYSAWQTVYGDRRPRNAVSGYVAGAIFTGLGVAAIGGHYALIYADSQNPCGSWECNVQRRALWIAASDGGALMLNTGFALFSWAGNYRRNRERYERLQWSVLPGVVPGSVGATASLRF